MKTAIVHDWLVSMGGAEKILQQMLDLYPSPVYTLVHDVKMFGQQNVKTSFLQKIPGSKKIYRNFSPLFPIAIEQFDLHSYDLILSSSHAVAKGVLTHLGQLHVCYCHTPMRYAWDLYHSYVRDIKGIKGKIAKGILHYLRNWDITSLNRVDYFIANSQYVARRIKKIYGKESQVIYPPVETDLLTLQDKKEDFYLTVSRLVPYKKIDLIVEAFGHLPDKRVVVIGEGPEMNRIRAQAKKNIEILGRQPDSVMRDYLGRAKGFISAADEDFGISVLEAQARGTPVIALARGGSLETVTEKTGIFFQYQTVSSLIEAIGKFETIDFDPWVIRSNAERFSCENFQSQFKAFVEEKWEVFSENTCLKSIPNRLCVK